MLGRGDDEGVRVALGVLCVASMLWAGCGGDRRSSASPQPEPSPASTQESAPAAAATPVPPAIKGCSSAGEGWREPDGRPVRGTEVAALGRGPVVMFLNDTSNDTCPWVPLARQAAGSARTAVVLTYRSIQPGAERAATRDVLAVSESVADGRRFVLVGASLGGRIVFEAAARRPQGLAGIVSLSGERRIDAYHDILPEVRRVRSSVLYIGARQDPLTDGTRQRRQLRAALSQTDRRFLALDGYAHGTELLQTPRVRAAIRRFLDQTLSD